VSQSCRFGGTADDSENVILRSRARVVVVANQKGGSGKTTVAINLAVGMIQAGMSVASLDADVNQESLTHFVENRTAWARLRVLDLPTPAHERLSVPSSEDPDAFLSRRLAELSATHQAIVIDTAGHNDGLNRSIHARADVLVTPLNDSFVDLDVLARFDPETLDVVRIGKYAEMVRELRGSRRDSGERDIEWIVVRNRLSAIDTRNKRHVGNSLSDLARLLDFRCAEGVGERLIFREFFTKGLVPSMTDAGRAGCAADDVSSHGSGRNAGIVAGGAWKQRRGGAR